MPSETPQERAAPTPRGTASKKIVLLVAMMASFLTPFTASSINVALPSIGATMALDAETLNWVATVYILAAVAFLLPFGRLADIRGRKRVFQIGVVIDAVSSILCAVAPSAGWLLAFRAFQGLGGAMIYGTSTAILTSVYPAQERGQALGLAVASTYTGLSVGPLIGGWMTQHFGWESAFLLNAALGAILSAVVFLRLHDEWAHARGESFDYVGSLFYCIAIVLLIYAFSVLPELWGFGLIALAIVGFALFLRWEGGQEFPVLKTDLFRGNAVFVFSNLAALVNYSATFAVSFLLSLYLQYIGGFTAEQAGLILIAQPVMMALCSPAAGAFSDKIEPRLVASIGMALTAAGLAMLSFLGRQANVAWVLASLIVLGIGFGLFSSPNTNAVMSAVARKFYGVAAGTLGTMRLTGQALSLGIVLLLFSIYIGPVQITPANYPLFIETMRMAFALSALICFIGIFASAARGKTKPSE
jgi:EmrB/QacA subfamily drug resistance transporter